MDSSSPCFQRRRLLAAASLLGLVPLTTRAAAPISVEGVTFAGEARILGQALQLNGVGLRAVAWLKAYAAGLYLPSRERQAEAVLAAPGAKRLQLRMLQDIDNEEFVKGFHRGVERNVEATTLAGLAERMAAFDAQVRGLGKLKKRDVVDLDWLPGRGLQMAFNDQARGEPIAGADLYVALLRIFIGERPVDPEMKAGLLGGPVA